MTASIQIVFSVQIFQKYILLDLIKNLRLILSGCPFNIYLYIADWRWVYTEQEHSEFMSINWDLSLMSGNIASVSVLVVTVNHTYGYGRNWKCGFVQSLDKIKCFYVMLITWRATVALVPVSCDKTFIMHVSKCSYLQRKNITTTTLNVPFDGVDSTVSICMAFSCNNRVCTDIHLHLIFKNFVPSTGM